MNKPLVSNQNTLFIYDLPKTHGTTSTALCLVIKNILGYDLEYQPQIRRDPNRVFYTALIRIDNPEMFQKTQKALRYFQFEGHQIRSLPYLFELTGQNLPKIADHNVFIKKIPKEIDSKKLEDTFAKYGEIISCKVGINEDYKSLEYGFVCFKEPQDALKALEDAKDHTSMSLQKYNPKSKADMRKVFNTIFVKDVPSEFDTKEGVEKLFGVYGTIACVFPKISQIEIVNLDGSKTKEQRNVYFVCFHNGDKADLEYGPRCAAKAVEEMNKKMFDGYEKPIYVAQGMNKKQRESKLKHETIQYKMSKKRCNLYVKNFPDHLTEQDLKNEF